MRYVRNLAALAIAASLGMTAGCNTGAPYAPPPYIPPVAMAPSVPGYALDLIGDRAARVRKARAAGLRVLPAAEVADYLARQETELRRQTAGTGVDVIRAGEVILLRLPASLTFNVGSSDISPQAASTLNEIGLTLKSYNRSLVDVLGHTDATGNPASNKTLSERRAATVAARLRARGVNGARIATRGYAATQPIGDEGSETGRALNRRVEIVVFPLR